MRVAGRQKGAKVKPYTHILVQPSAPKTRYVFAYYSSEAKAKAAHKKYEPLIGNPLRVVKQSGKSANTDMHEASERIPRKKGQPAGSDKHSDLYTDENPKGTIHGLKFATVDDAKASVSKIKNSGKKHAHQVQAAIAMEQRAKVMGKAGPAAVYRAFINKMKKKTKAMQKENIEENLWDNIRKRRASGKRMRKKGEKGAPTADAIRKAQAEDLGSGGTTTASIPNPADTAMGPRLKTTTMHDKRRKKDKFPVLLKRFRKYIEDHG
tara:strand:+ start:350 stop:1144 length:795 start_codon:yes stop_codon:yes gene_type:complete